MDGVTLAGAMSYPGYPAPLPYVRYLQLAGPCNLALVRAGCTTVARSAMFLSQIGAESGSLRWTEELADGWAYDRSNNWQLATMLGNVEAGDGPRYKGRSFIQITGRHNYAALSRWAASKGYVPSATYFIDHPQQLAADEYAFLGPVWYWTVARNMNRYADARDIAGGTRAVNGGYNNLSGRTARWRKCLSLGRAILPGTIARGTLKEGSMFELYRDQRTKAWYAGAPGYWHHIKNANEVGLLAGRPSCVNGAAARRLLGKPSQKALDAFSMTTQHLSVVKGALLARS